MAAVEVLEDDRDTSLPSSALSPAEYRSFRGLVNELDHTAGVNNNQISFYSVLEFLSSFNGVNQSVAQQIIEIVLGEEQEEFVGKGHLYAMIRLIGHWQSEGRVEKSMIFVQARVPDRRSKQLSEQPTMPSFALTSTTLNPFRANSHTSSSSTVTRTPGVDRGVEAFKRLLLSNKEGTNSESAIDSESTLPPRTLTIPAKLEDSASFHSNRTDQSHTGMTFVYTSDEEEEDEVVSSVKHSPETQLRSSPQPILPNDRTSLPPLTIPQPSPQKPLPPPSRKRGASGSNQPVTPNSEFNKPEEKTPKRNLPPAPPAPRRTLSSASTSHRQVERSLSLRRELPPQPSDQQQQSIKPPIPRPRRKLSDTSVTSVDIPPRIPIDVADPATSASTKRLSTQAPPPPPPPRGRKQPTETPSEPSSRRSTDLPSRLTIERPDSPRRSSAPEGDKPGIQILQDSELSLELGRLQKEVDELVYGLTKRRGGGTIASATKE